VRQVQSRIAALRNLATSHPEIAVALAELPRLSVSSVRAVDDTELALTTLAGLTNLIGDDPELAALRSDLQITRQSELEAAHLDRIAVAQQALAAALADAGSLESADFRRQASRAMRQLQDLAASDADLIRNAKEAYVAEFVSAAQLLIEAKRFSLARELLNAAAEQIPTAASITEARARLDAIQTSYRTERAEQQRAARLLALRQRFQLEVDSNQLERAGQTLAEILQTNVDGGFSRTTAPQRLAVAYADRAQQALAAGKFAQARQALDSAATFAPNFDRIDTLRTDVDIAQLSRDLQSWFAGETAESTATVGANVERYQTLLPRADFTSARDTWVLRVRDRLLALATEPEKHNALLADASTVLPDSALLASIMPIQIPTLELADILGDWCDKETRLEFTPTSMRFDLGRQAISYDVNRYQVRDEVILVLWQQSRDQAVEFEFGRFSESKTEMIQIRGREAGKNNWQTYNRTFSRCR
jgi:hypothetical protein